MRKTASSAINAKIVGDNDLGLWFDARYSTENDVGKVHVVLMGDQTVNGSAVPHCAFSIVSLLPEALVGCHWQGLFGCTNCHPLAVP